MNSASSDEEEYPFAQYDPLLKQKLDEMKLKNQNEESGALSSLKTFGIKVLKSKTIKSMKEKKIYCPCLGNRKNTTLKYLSKNQNQQFSVDLSTIKGDLIPIP